MCTPVYAQVSINQYGSDKQSSISDDSLSLGNGRNRDYEKDAVQFFINKLLKFGPEVQIKSLLGHRSQAAAEVRSISGRHLKDFVDFLTKVRHSLVRYKYSPTV
jgi:hypothetical protein